jgi:tetratricopeptide (TPR) repeat protein
MTEFVPESAPALSSKRARAALVRGIVYIVLGFFMVAPWLLAALAFGARQASAAWIVVARMRGIMATRYRAGQGRRQAFAGIVLAVAGATMAAALYRFNPAVIESRRLLERATANSTVQGGGDYLQEVDLDQAVADFSEALERDPDDVQARAGRGDAYLRQNELAAALEDYNRVLELKPDLAPAYFSRGIIYSLMGDPERAIDDYDRAIALDPEFDDAYYCRGLAYEDTGSLGQATEDWRQALAISDDPVLTDYVQQQLEDQME